jgi:hypothetical protein
LVIKEPINLHYNGALSFQAQTAPELSLPSIVMKEKHKLKQRIQWINWLSGVNPHAEKPSKPKGPGQVTSDPTAGSTR